MPRVQPEELRATLVQLYGEEHVQRMEAAVPEPDRVAIATEPPSGSPILSAPANDDPSPDTDEPQRIRDEEEAARFAAEIARDAALGDDANWPHP
jgi:hypothetical protein